MPEEFDKSRRRPLEIRVFDRREEGGVSEENAAESNGVTADAFLLMRVLAGNESVSLSYSAIEGWTAQEMSFEGLYSLWLALAGWIAKRPTDRPDHDGMRKFAEHVLNLMRLNVELGRLQADGAAEQPAPEPASG
jgi:hypothetical protein